MSNYPIDIIDADLDSPHHARAILSLLNAYALDIMGGKEALSDHVQSHLIDELKKRPAAHVVLAFVDHEPAGLLIALEGFSTFSCKPLLNIHDVVVTHNYRGHGISKRLMGRAEEIARQTGCCKLTLEVLEGNQVAQNLYQSCGYEGYSLDQTMGKALFWQKKL
jgi:GNAT superfamily N-acetyltransferase